MKDIAEQERRPAPRFGPEINRRMGQQLRVMYGFVMNQGVPDLHNELLQRLDAPEQLAGQ
jgi:hypothetical protein